MKTKPNDNVHWLSEEEYQKAVTQLRMQLNEKNGVFSPFRTYGLDAYIPGAIDEIIRLTEDFGLRVRGIDKPINIEYVRRVRK